MIRLGRLIDRVRRNRLLYGSLALSAVLLVKVAVFDPNLEFKPVCFNVGGGPFGGGFETIDGPQTEDFREAIRFNLARMLFSGWGWSPAKGPARRAESPNRGGSILITSAP